MTYANFKSFGAISEISISNFFFFKPYTQFKNSHNFQKEKVSCTVPSRADFEVPFVKIEAILEYYYQKIERVFIEEENIEKYFIVKTSRYARNIYKYTKYTII